MNIHIHLCYIGSSHHHSPGSIIPTMESLVFTVPPSVPLETLEGSSKNFEMFFTSIAGKRGRDGSLDAVKHMNCTFDIINRTSLATKTYLYRHCASCMSSDRTWSYGADSQTCETFVVSPVDNVLGTALSINRQAWAKSNIDLTTKHQFLKNVGNRSYHLW